jgi:ABC-2 type transport system permease protein
MEGRVHLFYICRKLTKAFILLCLAVFIFEALFPLMSGIAKLKMQMMEDMQRQQPEMLKMMGRDFYDAMMDYGFIVFGYIHPFLLVFMILYIFAAVSQVLTSEISTGSIGFILSRPVSRKRIYQNLAIVVYLGLAIMSLAALGGTYFGMWLFNVGGKVPPFFSIVINLYVLMLFIAGYIALFASKADTGKALFVPSGIILFVFYTIDLISALWEPFEYISPINPFSYYKPIEILVGQRLDITAGIAIPVVTALMFWLGARIFSRRDLPSG